MQIWHVDRKYLIGGRWWSRTTDLHDVNVYEDPGGITYFRRCLQSFLQEDAYRTKISEILQNYDTVVGNLRRAASPHYEDFLRKDQRELLLRSVLDYLRQIERTTRSVLYAFRYDYLRGSGSSSTTLSRDIDGLLERVHQEIERAIGAYFNQPIATAPPREDPVQEFDLRRIADDASNQLRRQFQEIVTSTVLDCVRQRVYEHLNRCKIRDHVKNLFRFPNRPELRSVSSSRCRARSPPSFR